MSDPRVIAWLRKLDANITEQRAERDHGFTEVHEELEIHAQQLASHTDELGDHERRLRRLERKVNGRG